MIYKLNFRSIYFGSFGPRAIVFCSILNSSEKRGTRIPRLVSRRDCRRRKIIGNRFLEESADHEETRRQLLRDCFRLLFEWQTHSVRNNGSRTRWDGFVGGRYVSGGRGLREGVVICIIPRLLVSRGSRVHGLQLLQQIRGITLCVTLSAGTYGAAHNFPFK